ncbi:OLC1v1000767C2 [Oldenlandia corymbosa var. corymbosa]|nr:OLC1v1000767C2 [Oldenlandia corymbosa var. corymbosa]
MALEEDHNVYNPEEELDEEEEEDDESGNHFNQASLNLANPVSSTANDINININADDGIDLVNNHPAQNDVVVDDEDDDVDVDEDEDVDDSTSSSNVALALAGGVAGVDPSSLLNHHLHNHQNHFPPPPAVAASAAAAGREVTIALPSDHHHHHSLPELNHPLVDEVVVATVAAAEGKKPMPIDESRKLFQRLWTDEDEIELLQGFLDYTTSRGFTNSSHHHDTTAFYDQIKCKLQLDFNKNQLVEKLRRLKKKYRNVMTKMGSGKEYVFKSPHDQATFEISRKIWGENGAGIVGGGGSAVATGRVGVVLEEGGFDDDETNHNFSINFLDQSPNLNFTPNHNHNHNPNGVDSLEKKTPRSRKRSRGGAVKVEEKQFGFNSVPNLQHCNQQPHVGLVMATATPIAPAVAAVSGVGTVPGPGPGVVHTPTPTQATPAPAPAPAPAQTPVPATNLIEETVRSCLSPIFKELLNSVMSSNGPMMGSSRGFGFALSPMPLGLNGDMVTDEKWRKQQILELEVYSKRLELVQEQIKAQLEELRSMGG